MAKALPPIGRLRITNRIIESGHERYQIRNITKIGKSTRPPKNERSYKLMTAGGAVATISFFVFYKEASALWLWGLPSGVLLGFFGWASMRKPTFALAIETSAASTNLLWSENETFIDQLVAIIDAIMERDETPANYTVNIAEGDITNNMSRDQIHVADTSGGQVLIKGSGVGNENSFNNSSTGNVDLVAFLEQLRNLAMTVDGAPNKSIADLEEELRSANPSPSRVSEVWSEICRAIPRALDLAILLQRVSEQIFRIRSSG